MTAELEQSIMSSLYSMKLISPIEINKILIFIENSCKKHKDRVYYKIQYYHIEPIMKQIKTRQFKNDNPFTTELENEYLLLLPNQSKEWLDKIYHEFNESFERMTEDRDYYFLQDKYPKRNNNKITYLQKRTTKYVCSRCNANVLLSSKEAHEKTDKCIHFGKENPNKTTTLQKKSTKYVCSRCNANVLLSSKEAHEKTDKCVYFGKEKENPRYKEKASPRDTKIICCNECNFSTSKINISRHRNKCDIFISSKIQVQ
jgi:DNA-directed RNA polymerase subunit RPC12/RpoP